MNTDVNLIIPKSRRLEVLRQSRLEICATIVLLVAILTLAITPAARGAVTVVSYWRMGESDPGAASGVTATNAIDSAGAKNLTFHGNASYANDISATAATRISSSLSVNFTNSAYATNAIVSTVTDNFGIECWVKPTALGGAGQVIAYNGVTGGPGSGGWGLIIAADNTYEGLFGGVTAFGTNVATANVWTHLALVRDSGLSTLYVNGGPSVTDPSTPAVPQGRFALAAPPQSPTSQFFTGLLDEVRVFTFAPGQFKTSDLLLNQPTSFRATTIPPTSLTTNTATLNGTINPGGLPTTAWFEWGLYSPFGSNTAAINLPATNAFIDVNSALTDLTPELAYQYRVVASNALGVVRGRAQQFWAPILTVNGNNPLSIKHQRLIDSSGATAHSFLNEIAAGYYNSAVLKADGTVLNWGLAGYSPPNAKFASVSAGISFRLGLKTDGTVVGWGDNSQGQINVPASATNVVAISAGSLHGIALRADGSVVGWGYNVYGQANTPATATNIIAISAGYFHNLALRPDGTVIGWGNNVHGQISIPAQATNVVAIAAGYYHNLALKADGSVISWGWDTFNQADVPADATNIIGITPGGYYSLALRADRTVIGWGNSTNGVLDIPVNATDVVALAAGYAHVLALKGDGTVVGWGDNTYGQANVPANLDSLNLAVGSTNNVNTNVLGSYQIDYFVTNALGTVATASRTVLVMDSPTVVGGLSATVVGTNSINGLRTVRFTATIYPNGSPTFVSIDSGLTSGYGNLSDTNLLPISFGPQFTAIDFR